MCSISDESAAGNTLAILSRRNCPREGAQARCLALSPTPLAVCRRGRRASRAMNMCSISGESAAGNTLTVFVKISFERGRIGALPCSVTRPHCRVSAGTESFTGDEYVFYLGRECRRQYSCGIVKAQLPERGRIGASVSSPYPPTPGEKTKKSAPD